MADSSECRAASPFAPSSGLAVASMVLGILAFFTLGLTSIPGLICGHVSLRQIRKSAGRLSGNGFAIGGLVTGYFSFFFLAVLMAGIALPVFAEVQNRARQVQCLKEARGIALGCKLYAKDHRGNYPPSLDALVPEYLSDKRLFACQIRKDQPPIGYNYFGGRDTDPSTNVLLSSKAVTRDHKRIIVTSDGAAIFKRQN
jgi:hypothetical protein